VTPILVQTITLLKLQDRQHILKNFIMKRNILLLVILLGISNYTIAQSWISSNRIYSDENISAIQSTSGPDGRIITLGYFSGNLSLAHTHNLTSYGGLDYFIVKFTELGDIDWVYQLGGSLNEYVLGGISTDADGNIFVTGGFRNYLRFTQNDSIQSVGGMDTFLAKLDSDGNVIWCNNIGSGSFNQRPNSLKVDIAGDVLIGGFFTDSIYFNASQTLYSDDGIDDYYYAKFDPDNGDLIWVKQIRSISNFYSGRIFAIETTQNAYYFGGQFADSTIIGNDTIISYNDSYDIHLFKTDFNGEIEWIREINGAGDELTYGIVADPDENIYLSGYYDSDTIYVQESDSNEIMVVENKGNFDFLVGKYTTDGMLEWFRSAGGKGVDKLNDITFFDNEITVSGYFSDTLLWGGIDLTTLGKGDQDMFIGAIDIDGNYRSANSFGGSSNSLESARAVFNIDETTYTIIRSNSSLLVLGDSIYVSENENDYIVIGVVGCQPISVDNVIVTDITTCYGDSTGAIQILATGGFGSPWQYSIDNGLSYQPDISYFDSLPAGDYPTVVIDKENCTQAGPTITINQPDTLTIEVLAAEDVTDFQDGVIQVAAYGGTAPYTYTLMPDSLVQGFGTYNFAIEDTGVYVVEVNDLRNCGPVATDSIEIGYDPEPNSLDPANTPELRVYPNPTSGMFTLEMPVDVAECSIEVLSLTGQVVHRHQAFSTGGMIIEVLDVSHLPKGMYMLRVNGKALRSGIVVN